MARGAGDRGCVRNGLSLTGAVPPLPHAVAEYTREKGINPLHVGPYNREAMSQRFAWGRDCRPFDLHRAARAREHADRLIERGQKLEFAF